MKEKQPNIGFKLIQIKTDQFAIFDENYTKGEDINLNSNLSFGLNEDERNLMVSTRFVFEIKERPFMSIQVSCFFDIEKKSWEKIRTDDTLVFPKGLVAHMSMLTVGTARGVLHAKTSNTKFNKYFLPTINVVKMVPEDIVFSLE